MTKLDVAGLSDKGSRDHNEDALGLPPSNLTPQQIAAKGQLYLVADGVGGHQAGDVASQMAIKTIQGLYYADPNPDVGASLQAAIEEANRHIYHQAVGNSQQYGMGTTITAAILHGGQLTVANVGDSRVYLIRGGQPIRLTQDHTWVAEAEASGLLSSEEASTHPRRNVITRSLGNKLEVQVDVFPPQAVGGDDALLLCSDGLSGVASDQEMAAIVTQRRNASQAVHQLVDLVKKRGAPDNVTALVVGLGERQAAKTVPLLGDPVLAGLAALAAVAVAFALILFSLDRGGGSSASPTQSASPTVPPVHTFVPSLTPPPPLDERPPLQLLEPANDASLPFGELITLRWSWRELGEKERFRFFLKQNDLPVQGFDGRVSREPQMLVDGLGPGAYAWGVAVEREVEGQWDPLLEVESFWRFSIQEPTPTATATPRPTRRPPTATLSPTPPTPSEPPPSDTPAPPPPSDTPAPPPPSDTPAPPPPSDTPAPPPPVATLPPSTKGAPVSP